MELTEGSRFPSLKKQVNYFMDDNLEKHLTDYAEIRKCGVYSKANLNQLSGDGNIVFIY